MSETHPHSALNDVIHGRRSCYVPGSELAATPVAVCAGSFNPLHPAHVQLLRLAERKTALPGIFELSITNVDKPPLDIPEIEKRMMQFDQQGLKLVLTNRPRYLEKIEIFPQGSFFVMGSDTFERVVNPRYYQPAESPLELFESAGIRFVVAPRRNNDGSVLTALDILNSTEQARDWASLTVSISPEEFLMDISSTAIRRGHAV